MNCQFQEKLTFSSIHQPTPGGLETPNSRALLCKEPQDQWHQLADGIPCHLQDKKTNGTSSHRGSPFLGDSRWWSLRLSGSVIVVLVHVISCDGHFVALYGIAHCWTKYIRFSTWSHTKTSVPWVSFVEIPAESKHIGIGFLPWIHTLKALILDL